MNSSALRVAAATLAASALLTSPLRAGEVYAEDFNSGYKRGPLVGQENWVEAIDPSSPIVFDTFGEFGHEGWALTSSEKASSNNFAMKKLSEVAPPDDRIVVEMIASRGISGDFGCGVALGFGAEPQDKTIGISQVGVEFRDGWGRTEKALAEDGSDWNDFDSGDIIVLRSVWDRQAGTADLAIKNLTREETEFTPLFFDAAQTKATVDLGESESKWNTVYVRLTGTKQARLYSASITTED